MHFDGYGLSISTDSLLAADCYRDGIDRLLSLNAGAVERLTQAVAADPDFALAHAALALALYGEGKSLEAAAACTCAAELVARASRREQRHVAAVTAILSGDVRHAGAVIRAQLAEHPREALLLRFAGPMLSSGGSHDWREAVCALYDDLRESYGADWWFPGAHALYLQECGRVVEARRQAERSLAANGRNAMAAHALVHVLHVTGDTAGLRHFLGGWIATYERAAPFYCHLAWHLALAELAEGRVREAIDRYQRDVRPVLRSRPGMVQADAASLLWRLRLQEIDLEPSLGADLTVAAASARRPGSPFVDAHTALALALAGDWEGFGVLLDRLTRLTRDGDVVVEEVVLPLALGIGAFASGDYQGA